MIGNREPRGAQARQTLDVLAGRWVLDVVEQLATSSPMRYGELADAIPEIAEGSLSRTLRQIGRDGLVRRIVRPDSLPVQVDYALTPLGDSVTPLLEALAGWAVEQGSEVEMGSRMRGDTHVRLGGRAEKTDRRKRRNGVSVRPLHQAPWAIEGNR